MKKREREKWRRHYESPRFYQTPFRAPVRAGRSVLDQEVRVQMRRNEVRDAVAKRNAAAKSGAPWGVLELLNDTVEFAQADRRLAEVVLRDMKR